MINPNELFIKLVETSRLNREQMLEFVKLSDGNQRIAKAVIKRIDWDGLSSNQIVETVKLSGGNQVITQKALETGKLFHKQVLEIIELSRNDWLTIGAVMQGIDWNNMLSSEEMIEAIKLTDGDWRIALTVIETGKLSVKQLLEVIRLSNNNPSVIETVVDQLKREH